MSEHEFPVLQRVREYGIANPDARILYLHTKGVTSDALETVVTDWRRLMLYFLVWLHEHCLLALRNADVAGINKIEITDQAPRHYSGNFWWATGRHVARLPAPLTSRNRYEAEFWIGRTNAARMLCLYSSGLRHYYALCRPWYYITSDVYYLLSYALANVSALHHMPAGANLPFCLSGCVLEDCQPIP